jgi:hypothetical protein
VCCISVPPLLKAESKHISQVHEIFLTFHESTYDITFRKTVYCKDNSHYLHLVVSKSIYFVSFLVQTYLFPQVFDVIG